MAKSDGIEAGKLNRRVQLQAKSIKQRGSQGGAGEKYMTYATVWAHIRPLRGDERIAAGQIAGQRKLVVRARYQHATKPADRILFPLLSLTDLATVDPWTTITSATGGFTAHMAGMALQITAGTNWITGDYDIASWTDTNTIALAVAAAGLDATSGTGVVGRVFYVEEIINVNEANVVMELHCNERIG